MKTTIPLSLILCFAGPLLAADATPLDQVRSAAKALADAKNYAWVSTPRSEGNSANWRQGPLFGQTEKDGYTYFKFELGDNTIEAAFKGPKSTIKLQDNWVAASELIDDQAWIAERLKAYRPPAGEAVQLAEATTNLEQTDETLGGPLTAKKVEELLVMRRASMTIKDAKGTTKFWIKAGVLTKYQFNIRGKVGRQDGEEFDLNRTVTVEIKDIGSTKVSVPDEAKQKL